MKRANKVRITEHNLSEHIRQENAAYRAIIRESRPMPWCERCQCYHHEGATHIRAMPWEIQ
jgi:hypothetical protein